MYKLCKNLMTGEPSPFILRIADNAYIPMVDDNTDYQAYLKWVAEGNTPLPADEVK